MSIKYTDGQVENIRKSVNIVDVISKSVVLEKRGDSYFGECPICKKEGLWLGVSEKKQMYYCFNCQKGGNVFTYIMQTTGKKMSEAVEYLSK